MTTQKQSQQFYRPFQKTGFVPLPQKSKKKSKIGFKTQKNPVEDIQHLEDFYCLDCYDDCYEDKYCQILLYLISRQFSLRMPAIKSIKVRLQQQYIISQISKQYKAYVCQNGTYHLKLNNQKVLMVREAFRLVAKVHSQFHLDGQLMYTIIKTEYSYLNSHSISQFIKQFPLMCPYCKQFGSLQPSLMPTPKSRIWFYLEPTRIDYEDEGDQNEILTYSRPSAFFPNYVSPNIQPIQQTLEQVQQMKKRYISNIFDPFTCQPGTCEHDQYQTEYLMTLFVFKQNKYPLFKTNNTSAGKLIYAIRARIKQFQVRVCNQGTDHLWHRERNQRVLMKDQINTVLQILHNGNVTDIQATNDDGKGYFHRNQKLMRFILEKQFAIFPFNIISSMGSFLNKCPPCCRKKIWSEYKRQQVYFEQNQMAEFRAKMYQARKRYRATKQAPKNLNYQQMLSKNQGLKSELLKIPSVVDGQVNDPNDTHPNDQQQSPEVRAMLQKYVDHPELFQFFSNDLIWLTSFNERRYPDAIADQNIWIRKYMYDGMYRVIMVTTQSMRQKYYESGECICIDFIPMMIKRRSPSGRHFEIGFLTGMDSENKTLLFGVCFMSQDLMIYHRKMMQFFFQMVNQIIPGTIITNSGKNLSQAVYLMKKEDPLKYRFNHYIGWFYVIQDLKKDLSGEYDRAVMLKQFCNLLVQANPITYQKRLIEITSQIVQRSILNKFLKQKNKYCLSCLPAAFMGYAMQTKRVQDLFDHLSENFIYQSRMAKFMYYVFQFEKKMNFRKPNIDSGRNLEKISEVLANGISFDSAVEIAQQSNLLLRELSDLSEALGQNILDKLMKNVEQAQKLVLLQDEESISRGDSFDAFFLDSDHLKYSVRYSTQDQCWRCSCPWIYWTGLPCPHLLKMVMKLGGNLRYYINQRWLVDPDQNQFVQQETVKPNGEMSEYMQEQQNQEGYNSSEYDQTQMKNRKVPKNMLKQKRIGVQQLNQDLSNMKVQQ